MVSSMTSDVPAPPQAREALVGLGYRFRPRREHPVLVPGPVSLAPPVGRGDVCRHPQSQGGAGDGRRERDGVWSKTSSSVSSESSTLLLLPDTYTAARRLS